MILRTLCNSLVLVAALAASDAVAERSEGRQLGQLRPVAQLDNVPVGIAVSREGRIFLAFSRAIDPDAPISVAEWKDGGPRAFPEGLRQGNGEPSRDRLLAVQALTVDGRDRLWILDSAKVGDAQVAPGAPKLVAVDLSTGRIVKTISFPTEVAGANAFLNDVRIDLRRGAEGMAFLTDASAQGPNGLLVVDLATSRIVRRLNDHPSTKPVPGFVAQVEGKPLVVMQGEGAGKPGTVGADGIALDASGHHVYYAPTSSHQFYRVSADALADPAKSDAEVAKTVEPLGDKGFASDGLLGDAEGRLYLTDYEHNAIHRRAADGTMTTVARDTRLVWPDSLALGQDGRLYVTATQINRGKKFRGSDQRSRPFTVWSFPTDSRPLLLGGAPGVGGAGKP